MRDNQAGSAIVPSWRAHGPRRANLKRWLGRVFFLLPAVAILLLFRFWPTIEAFQLSLTNWTGLREPRYIGFENFRRIVQDPAFLTALRNNFIILASAPLGVGLPLGVALMLNTRIFLWRWFRAAFFLPAALSPVIIGTYYSIVFLPNGPLNSILEAIGLEQFSHPWLADSATALPAYIAVMLWSIMGIGVVIFMAALSAIDPDLEDSARIEGASWLQIQRHVAIPEIRRTIQFWFALYLIFVFTAQFPLVYTLTRGGPGHSSNVLEFLIYQRGFSTGSLGYASAMGVVLFLIVAVVFGGAFWFFRWISRDRR